MTLEAWALVWLAVQAREVQNESAAESVTQFVPNLGACNMQSNFSLFYCTCFRYIRIYMRPLVMVTLSIVLKIGRLFQGGLFSPMAALNREAWVIC